MSAHAKMDQLNKEWQVEKAQINEAKDLKGQIEKAKFDLEQLFRQLAITKKPRNFNIRPSRRWKEAQSFEERIQGRRTLGR
jgi:hypothetical protein